MLSLPQSPQTKVSVRPAPSICLRAVSADDGEFLYQVYASTRRDELACAGWDGATMETFLRMQFQFQDAQYRRNAPGTSFDVILVDDMSAGRLYLRREEHELRLVDIALLPTFRGRGIGSRILKDLVMEADAKGLLMSLHVEQANHARRLYESLGFQQRGGDDVYLYMERQAMSGAHTGEAART